MFKGFILLSSLVCLTSSTLIKPSYYDILEINKSSSISDIKRAYRIKALQLHPDRRHINEELFNNTYNNTVEDLKDLFLAIQNAYEILSDPETRLKYDLELQGVAYDILNDNIHTNADSKYSSKPFFTYMKGKKFRFSLSVKYDKQAIPDITAYLHLDLASAITPVDNDREIEYYRRNLCSVCYGKGGLSFRTCSLCQGKGTAYHYNNHYCSSSSSSSPQKPSNIRQITSTTCQNCHGKGHIIIEKCEACQSSGYHMQSNKLHLRIPFGVRANDKVTLEGLGHSNVDGRVGNVIVHTLYNVPDGWSLNYTDGRLSHRLAVPWKVFVSGGHAYSVVSPVGEEAIQVG